MKNLIAWLRPWLPYVLFLALVTVLLAWPIFKVASRPTAMIEVKIVQVHRYDPKHWATDRGTHMVVERQDTKERKTLRDILGEVGDTFTMQERDW